MTNSYFNTAATGTRGVYSCHSPTATVAPLPTWQCCSVWTAFTSTAPRSEQTQCRRRLELVNGFSVQLLGFKSYSRVTSDRRTVAPFLFAKRKKFWRDIDAQSREKLEMRKQLLYGVSILRRFVVVAYANASTRNQEYENDT